MARDNQLTGLQAGQAASLPLRCVVLGHAAGPQRHSGVGPQLLLTLSATCLIQICMSALLAKSWGLTAVSLGGQAAVELWPPCSKIGMKEKGGKGPSSRPWGQSLWKLFLSVSSTESHCFLCSGGYTCAFAGPAFSTVQKSLVLVGS